MQFFPSKNVIMIAFQNSTCIQNSLIAQSFLVVHVSESLNRELRDV